METPEFEWDDEKALSNLKKHDVSFEEAATVFNDPLIATMFDPDHSEDEERYVSMGISVERGERIRSISCRKATSAERKAYEKN
jgi:uncharacterized protein